MALSPNDPSSYSRPDLCTVTNIHLNLRVDFEKKILSGCCDLEFEKKNADTPELILDTRDLSIQNVFCKETGEKLSFQLGEKSEHFGSKFAIKLPSSPVQKSTISITYSTSPSASALQWMTPEQTAGKEYPYLFSQCQAIHARSMLPCQDTPAVKTPYSAVITVPRELTALMSAVRDGEEPSDDPTKKSYVFCQKVPIPSYLIAIVVGALESRKIGPRSHVWSEKKYVDKAAYEFAETEQMIQVAEKLLGEYVWGIYDLLVLPPSFPYGGMENPCLTFVTPTLLAGDRSLVDVIAHEIAHSWTGNLVTNSNFEHFWLNEGFTVFVERKIVGRMHGESYRHFEAIGGWKELKYTIDTKAKDDEVTKLVPNLIGVDPDDAYCSVPYEKGHTLLFYLEEKLGGPSIFEPFLRSYIEKYKYRSIDTDEWKRYLLEYFHDKVKLLADVDWNAWLYTPGMPPVKPKFDSTLASCHELGKQWVEADVKNLSFSEADLKNMSSQQIREFLAYLLECKPLPLEKVKKMTELYKFKSTRNAEIRFRWLRLCLLARWIDIVPMALEFVTEQGRMKYVRPIYRDLYEWKETRDLILSVYESHKDEMMYVLSYTLAKDLHL